MRVTDRSATYGTLSGLQSAASRLSSLQAKLSSGKQITTPSDDPSGTVRALQLRATAKRYTQYAASANDAIGWLSTADSAYSRAVGLVQNARTLVVQGLNAGAQSPSGMAAIADQVDAISSSLIQVANTAYNGRPVFGGTTSGTAAYDSSGNYVGDGGVVSRTVGEKVTVQINQNGPQVFGSGSSDLFALLSNISANLRSNPSALSANLTALDGALSTISSAQAAEGAAYSQVQNQQTVATDVGTNIATQLSDIQDVDIADMAVQVSAANVTYQAALQTTANVRQLSLLEFLR
ncbi:MAG TPA: flagellar hook-associated protein FlgL [Jatrophihabitans sp.]|jgi:flagellar hook-associated protein 3 FlgL|nr:flagellar hook-associated protein FlgL [Jatrophihabitans sp.]